MRIVRFLSDDGRELLGEDHGDGEATVLIDAHGVLGPPALAAAARAMLKDQRVIIADDDEALREITSIVLSKHGSTCRMCADGDEAAAAIHAGGFDVVVSDVVMPGRDGHAVFELARAAHPGCPVVLMTGFGYDPGHAAVRAAREGIDTMLYKPFTPPQLIEAIMQAFELVGAGGYGGLVSTGERVRIGPLRAPVRPRNVICAGRIGAAPPDNAFELFMKPTTAIQDPDQPIRIPGGLDFDPAVEAEGELAVVIGRTMSNVAPEEALSFVFGYTLANDVAAVGCRREDAPMSWMRGKGFDTFCPLGPAIITTDAAPDVADWRIATLVNGEETRGGVVNELTLSVATLLSRISARITLEPGTVVLTGGPPALAQRTLQAGDEACVESPAIGRLRNPVRAS